MSHLVVETVDLHRNFGNTKALRGVSLTVPPHQVLALVGPNGAGKSTLLKLLLGHLVPTSGDARVWGHNTYPPAIQIAGRVASVCDGHQPPRGTTVQGILNLNQGAVARFDARLATELCCEREIGTNRFWHALSKGQRRWVLIAAAVASHADLYLLDEPADGLDPTARRRLYGLLRELADEQGATVIVASHILSDIERSADHIAVLIQGRLYLSISLEQMREEVREIEVTRDFDTDDLPAGVELLVQRELGSSRLLWVRHHELLHVENSLPDEIQRRSVGLDDLYAALTSQPDSTTQVSEFQEAG